jgi:hypothetical protein
MRCFEFQLDGSFFLRRVWRSLLRADLRYRFTALASPFAALAMGNLSRTRVRAGRKFFGFDRSSSVILGRTGKSTVIYALSPSFVAAGTFHSIQFRYISADLIYNRSVQLTILVPLCDNKNMSADRASHSTKLLVPNCDWDDGTSPEQQVNTRQR